jgi:hypothetical protein
MMKSRPGPRFLVLPFFVLLVLVAASMEATVTNDSSRSF